jgi:GNAT superfamily N-acetyltransferase
MSEFTIERVSATTIHELFYLLEQLAAYEHLNPLDEEAKTRLTQDILQEHPKIEAYIGRYEEKPIGCITFFFTYSTFIAKSTLFLEDLFVLEEYRGHGFGKKLFEFSRSEAKNRGCGRMDWMVLTWNEPSIRFYEQIGGTRLGWYTYRLEDTQL